MRVSPRRQQVQERVTHSTAPGSRGPVPALSGSLFGTVIAILVRLRANDWIRLVRRGERPGRGRRFRQFLCGAVCRMLRRECLDHLLIYGDGHLRRILTEYTQTLQRASAAPIAGTTTSAARVEPDGQYDHPDHAQTGRPRLDQRVPESSQYSGTSEPTGVSPWRRSPSTSTACRTVRAGVADQRGDHSGPGIGAAQHGDPVLQHDQLGGLEADDRPSRTSQPQSRTKMRQSRRRDTNDHDALRLALVIAAAHRTGRLLAPRRTFSIHRSMTESRPVIRPSASLLMGMLRRSLVRAFASRGRGVPSACRPAARRSLAGLRS